MLKPRAVSPPPCPWQIAREHRGRFCVLTGVIQKLIKVRAASSTSVTPTLSVAVEYKYDPYGKLLSITKASGESVGTYNPLGGDKGTVLLSPGSLTNGNTTNSFGVKLQHRGPTQGTVLCVDDFSLLCYNQIGDAICQDRRDRKAKAESTM